MTDTANDPTARELEQALMALASRHIDTVRPALDAFLARVSAHGDRELEQSVRRAAIWALGAHRDKERKPDKSHYMHHVLEVTGRLERCGGESRQGLLAAGLLHDSLEDAAGWLALRAPTDDGSTSERAAAAIGHAFGDRTRTLVEGVTNPDFDAQLVARGLRRDTDPYDEALLELYADHFIAIFMGDDLDLQAVKLADFSSNALNLDHFEPTSGTYKWLVRKYRPCVALIRDRGDAIRGTDHPVARIYESLADQIDTAWARHYG